MFLSKTVVPNYGMEQRLVLIVVHHLLEKCRSAISHESRDLLKIGTVVLCAARYYLMAHRYVHIAVLQLLSRQIIIKREFSSTQGH